MSGSRSAPGEDGRIVSLGHADHGSRVAREILWRLNVPIEEREEIVSLIRLHHLPFHCAENRARVHIVYIERSEDLLMQQNRRRESPVPERVMKRLISRWQVPDRTEAHRIDWIVPAIHD